MNNAIYQVPKPVNEPIREYRPGSPERESLQDELDRQYNTLLSIPIQIGKEKIYTDSKGQNVCPHEFRHVLADYSKAGEREVSLAIETALKAREAWADMAWTDRAAIFLKAADLLAGPWRDRINAATMLNAGKTVHQAEIDAACELIDFFRFNVYYMQQIFSQQPASSPGAWNRLEQRPLEGFVFAVTPFNFASIAGNLPSAPALMGNVVLWKPASTTVYIAHHIMELFKEAGLPDGVITLLPGSGAEVGDPVLASPHLAGIHFTGSTSVFQGLWKKVGDNIQNYKTYPRIVGETGGKDFVFAHASADVRTLAAALVRGAFEYQGQKCSAASRAYIPQSIWPALKDKLVSMICHVSMGDPREFSNFMGAVIDEASYRKIVRYLGVAHQSDEARILIGGHEDGTTGYFIEPTIIETANPRFKTMEEEIFGPVLTVYVYPDEAFEETLKICDETSPYALTGAVFARDREAINRASEVLKNAAGNFYINDKPTGAVVGQQPFGGGRASGTNDKAGSLLNLLRWTSPRTIKENFSPPLDFRYPHMEKV